MTIDDKFFRVRPKRTARVRRAMPAETADLRSVMRLTVPHKDARLFRVVRRDCTWALRRRLGFFWGPFELETEMTDQRARLYCRAFIDLDVEMIVDLNMERYRDYLEALEGAGG